MKKQFKFTQELKDKWLEALKSGEYEDAIIEIILFLPVIFIFLFMLVNFIAALI